MGLAEIFKKLFGTKADRDMKAIRPILDKVLAAYAEIDALSDDQLRAKTLELKAFVADKIAADEKRIAEIKLELEGDIDIDQKEKLATESDKLTKKIDEDIEAALNEILPQAFAIVKSTARRFAQNSEIFVEATEFDRNLSAKSDFVEIRQGENGVPD